MKSKTLAEAQQEVRKRKKSKGLKAINVYLEPEIHGKLTKIRRETRLTYAEIIEILLAEGQSKFSRYLGRSLRLNLEPTKEEPPTEVKAHTVDMGNRVPTGSPTTGDKQATIDLIIKLREVDNLSYPQIGHHLDSNQIPTFRADGNKWDPSTISRIYKRESERLNTLKDLDSIGKPE